MIIITSKVHQYLLDTLTEKGYEYLYAPDISYKELFDKVADATGLVVTTRIPIDKPMIDKAQKLQWIGRLGSGMELIDVTYASEKNIRCVSSPEGNRNAVAEHALGMLLNIANHICRSQDEVRKGIWNREENRGTEISGKVIGIVGFGNTGSSFAKLLSSFDVSILAYDKYLYGFGNAAVKEASLEQLCRYADVISFHVPLTALTKYMANDDFFSALQNRPFIINTSRGGVIETGSLIKAIGQDLIRGAALDVLENEKIGTLNSQEQANLDFLCAQENVLITPHIAGYSHEAYYKMSRILLQKLDIDP
mgnify:CR=1 FL=1